jgi:copper chaperone
MGQQSYTVTGMSCGGCEDNVESSVGDIEGVTEVEADNESDTVEVVADGVGEDDITAAIEDAGYDVDA